MDTIQKNFNAVPDTTQEHIANRTQESPYTLATRGLARAAAMIVIYRLPLPFTAHPTLAAVSPCKSLILLWGKVVLLGYVRQSTGQ